MYLETRLYSRNYMKEIVEKLDIIKISNFLPVKDNVKINEDIRHTIRLNICRRHRLRDTKNTTIKKPYRWLKNVGIFEVHFKRGKRQESMGDVQLQRPLRSCKLG